MKCNTQRTTGQSLDSNAVVRATFGWWGELHEISLGKDDPVLPNSRRS